MGVNGQSKEQLMEEVIQLRLRVNELDHLEKQHKQTEIELEAANSFLQNILQSSSNISIISTDIDHNIIFWNRGAEQLFGYSSGEVVGKHKIDILYPNGSTNNQIKQIRTHIFEKHENYICEIEEMTRNGRKIWVKMNLTPRFDENGKVIGVLGIGEDISQRKGAENQLQKSLMKLKKTLRGVINVMEMTVEARDPYTAGHQKRVAALAVSIGKEMGLSHERLEGLQFAGIVHDLGKLSVPAEILVKPGKLNELQFSMIKTHPQVGYDILKTIDFPWPIARIILEHHERIDGSGYPSGLTNKDLLLESKILSVADVVEAMASHRPYRAALGVDKALEEILEIGKGHYDEEVVTACMSFFRKNAYKFEPSLEALAEPELQT